MPSISTRFVEALRLSCEGSKAATAFPSALKSYFFNTSSAEGAGAISARLSSVVGMYSPTTRLSRTRYFAAALFTSSTVTEATSSRSAKKRRQSPSAM